LFSFISMNWRGRSHTDIRTIIELIGATTIETGLSVQAVYDNGWCAKGIKISNTDYNTIPSPPTNGTTQSPPKRSNKPAADSKPLYHEAKI